MKRVLFLVVLALAIAFFVLLSDDSNNKNSLPHIKNATVYCGTIGVILPNNSVIADQVRNGIDTAYLLQGAKARPSLLYLNGADLTSIPVLDAVVTATDEISSAWDLNVGLLRSIHVAVASPGYAANSPKDVITLSTPPYYEILSLRPLIKQHNIIGVLGLDNLYTAAYIRDLEDITSSKIVSEVFTSSVGVVASLKSLLVQNPDLLIITSGEDIPALVEKIREFGLTCPVAVSSWIGEITSIVNDSRMNGVYTAKRISNTSSHPFYNVYQSLFGTAGSVYAAEGYDAMMTLSRLILQSNGDMQYVSCWYMDRDYEGAAGSYWFDGNGSGIIQMQIAQFRSEGLVHTACFG